MLRKGVAIHPTVGSIFLDSEADALLAGTPVVVLTADEYALLETRASGETSPAEVERIKYQVFDLLHNECHPMDATPSDFRWQQLERLFDIFNKDE